MGRFIGYARVSTADQDLQLQIEALHHAGCRDAQIFRDVASGARTARPGLEACLHALAPGDTLVVWRLEVPAVARVPVVVEQDVAIEVVEQRSVRHRSTRTPPKNFIASGGP